MQKTPRLRSYSPDSHVFMDCATIDQQDDDTIEERALDQRRLRTALLSHLKFDETALDLACHRVMSISNRTSAEQFGIDPSVANRKGRRAVKMLFAAGVTELLNAKLKEGESIVLDLTLPLQVIPITNGFVLSHPDQSTQFRRCPTQEQLSQFLRRADRRHAILEQAMDTEQCGLSRTSRTVVAGWSNNEIWTIIAGTYMSSDDLMMISGVLPNDAEVWALRNNSFVSLQNG